MLDRIPFGGFPWGRLAFSQADSPLGRLAWLGGVPLVSAVVARGYVDPEELYVTGGSGGGVLTCWMIGNTDRRRERGHLKTSNFVFDARPTVRFGMGEDRHPAGQDHLLTSDTTGAVNLTAPFPVTNGVFTATLGDVLGRPTFMPIPKFGPKLLLGSELAENLLFTGQRVLPVVLEHDPGFEFRYSDLESALQALLES